MREEGESGRGRMSEAGKRPDYIPDGLPTWWGCRRATSDMRRDEGTMFAGSENRSADSGGCCSRLAQLVAPFQISAIIDWGALGHEKRRSRLHTHTRGALVGTSCHVLARVWPRAAPVFAPLWMNGTQSSHAGMAGTTLRLAGCICQFAYCAVAIILSPPSSSYWPWPQFSSDNGCPDALTASPAAHVVGRLSIARTALS
jgi:hypothetical protein